VELHRKEDGDVDRADGECVSLERVVPRDGDAVEVAAKVVVVCGERDDHRGDADDHRERKHANEDKRDGHFGWS
jgi:hypothetical protein